MQLATILAAIQSLTQITPEFIALMEQLKDVFSEKDRDAIDQALAESTARADAQHAAAQGL